MLSENFDSWAKVWGSRSQGRCRVRLLNKRYQSVREDAVQILPVHFPGKEHFLIWVLKQKHVWRKRSFSPFKVLAMQCVCPSMCVYMQRVSMWDCETSNLPLLQNVLHSWRQLPTANSILWGYLRSDKLNLTVIRLISPFRCRYCLPGRAARQPYLCLQLPETKSFSPPVIFSLRPCTQRHSKSQTSNAGLYI